MIGKKCLVTSQVSNDLEERKQEQEYLNIAKQISNHSLMFYTGIPKET